MVCKFQRAAASFPYMRITAITALALLAGCSRGPQSVHIDPSLSTLVPHDTELMVGTRLEKLLKTPLYQNYFAERNIPQINQFAEMTGIDPRKDLWELLFVSNGKTGVLLGRGKFADEMMEPQLERHGAQRFGYKGLTMFGDQRSAVVLINSTTGALGQIEPLKALVDQVGSTNGPTPKMEALIRQIPPQAQFWAAYGGGPIHLPFDENSNLGNLNRLLGSIQTGTVWFDLSTGLTGSAEASCASDDGAQQVQGALKALVGIGRLSVPKNQPDLAQVYDAIQITQDGHIVKLHLDVPQSMVDKFLGLWLGHK
ncbi:MAG TPA: hypothetical protein VMG40_16130 [Bryobacteraceae bacterium]|nr:hypothetical protein [Bryobacteraceae bacterium]